MDRGETCLEGHCFGAPIFSPERDVFAAISISLPVSRLGSLAYQARILERITSTAREIGRTLTV